MSRRFDEAKYDELRAALKLDIEALGGLEAAASCTRVGRSQLSDYTNSLADKFVPVDVVLDLESVGGNPRVASCLARALGFELAPVLPRDGSALADELVRIGRDVADLLTHAAHGLKGKELLELDRQAMIQSLDDLRRAAAEAMQLLGAPRPGEHRPRRHEREVVTPMAVPRRRA